MAQYFIVIDFSLKEPLPSGFFSVLDSVLLDKTLHNKATLAHQNNLPFCFPVSDFSQLNKVASFLLSFSFIQVSVLTRLEVRLKLLDNLPDTDVPESDIESSEYKL